MFVAGRLGAMHSQRFTLHSLKSFFFALSTPHPIATRQAMAEQYKLTLLDSNGLNMRLEDFFADFMSSAHRMFTFLGVPEANMESFMIMARTQDITARDSSKFTNEMVRAKEKGGGGAGCWGPGLGADEIDAGARTRCEPLTALVRSAKTDST